ncbi:MAG: hypothetical protein NUV34_03130 [Sulfuricaulis sp.]|nr:hypothetical protein [Sulfuricaulis sp.]
MSEQSGVSLREHLESQIKWLDRHVAGQLTAIDASTVKALAQLDERLRGMNEFRDALKDQASRLMTRKESEAQHESIESRLKSMELTRAAGEGKVLIISGLVAFVASVLVAIVTRWLIQ